MSSQIERYELSIEEARKIIKQGEAVLALADHSTFREVVLEGYFKEEASRLVRLYSDPNIDKVAREFIERDMHGIGAFQRYMQRFVRMGDQAQRDLESAEAFLEEARQAEMELAMPEAAASDDDDDTPLSPTRIVAGDYAGNLGA